MSNPFDVFKDDNFDGEAGTTKPLISVAQAQAGKDFIETCPKCRGSGRFISYGGRNLGPCYSCKGKGSNSYKSSPQARAKAKTNRAEKFGRDLETWCAEHKDIVDWFVRAVDQRPNNPFRFAVSLREALAKYGSLTDNQVAAARKCIAQDAERSAARVAAAPVVDATKIEQAFAHAREKAARPGQQGTFTKPLALTSPDKITLSFQPGSLGSQWADMLFVKSAEGVKLGHIKGGKFFRKFDCSDAEAAAITTVAADPETAVVAYAKAFSRCGVCGQTLLNDVSIARGIGPICAEKFGW